MITLHSEANDLVPDEKDSCVTIVFYTRLRMLNRRRWNFQFGILLSLFRIVIASSMYCIVRTVIIYTLSSLKPTETTIL